MTQGEKELLLKTQEERKLLLRDLSASLPYGVKIMDEPAHCLGELFLISTTDMVEYETETDTGVQTIYNIKPYLRPMSSMTDEEKKTFTKLKQMSVTVIIPNHATIFRPDYIVDLDDEGDGLNNLYDWLNANHFDYRNLIEKGLAMAAPEGMYKTE